MRDVAFGVMRKTLRLAQELIRGKDIADEYVEWLTFANAGMLVRGNLACFDYAMANLPSDAPMLEIGSFCGLSTNLIGYYKQRRNAHNKLFTCDKWHFEGADGKTVGDSSITTEQYRTFVKDTFIRNVRMFSGHDLPHTIEAFSDELFGLWRERKTVVDVFGNSAQLGGKLSFCFIDGDHSYAQANRDFQNCHEFLEPGGFVLLDDSADGSGWEVNRVAREVRARSDYELISRKPNYMFRKKR